jgi:cytoskeletal protein RodZ
MQKHTISADREKGFVHLGLIVLVVLVIGVVGFAGWRLYSAHTDQRAGNEGLANSRATTLKENEEKAFAPPEVQTPASTVESTPTPTTTTPQTTPTTQPNTTTTSPTTPASTPTPAPAATPTSWITNPTAADCSRFASIPTIWMAKNDANTMYDPEGNAYHYQGTIGYRQNLTDMALNVSYKAPWGNNPQWGNKIECYQTGWLQIQNVSSPFYLKWSDVSITAPSSGSCSGTTGSNACQ